MQDPDLYKVGKTLIEGAGWLGVADVFTGGKVRQLGKAGWDKIDKVTGNITGKEQDSKGRWHAKGDLSKNGHIHGANGRWYAPNEDLPQSKLADYEKSLRPGDSNPHTNRPTTPTTHSSTNTMTAENTAFAIDSSSNKFSNSSIMPNDNAHVKGMY